MSERKDGGPAFPVGDQSLHPLMIGMTLRDYFAAAALHGMCANPNVKEDVQYAQMSYRLADDMLKERDR